MRREWMMRVMIVLLLLLVSIDEANVISTCSCSSMPAQSDLSILTGGGNSARSFAAAAAVAEVDGWGKCSSAIARISFSSQGGGGGGLPPPATPPPPPARIKRCTKTCAGSKLATNRQIKKNNNQQLKRATHAPASRTIASETPSHVSLATAATASANLQLHESKRSSKQRNVSIYVCTYEQRSVKLCRNNTAENE
jgi:hypothetical protein